MNVRHAISTVAVIAASTTAAHAGFVNATVSVNLYSVFEGNSYQAAFGEATVEKGDHVEFSGFDPQKPTFDIDFTDDTFTISNFVDTYVFDGAEDFNGLAITADGRTFNSLTLIDTNFKSMQPDGSLSDFDASQRLSLDAGHLRVDLGGLAYDPSTYAKFSVGFADSPDTPAAVPAPTAAPAGVALLLLALRQRRRPLA